VTRQSFEATETGLSGANIQGISRRGKQIFIELDRGVLYVHLGMTGQLLWNAPEDKFTRAVLELDTGALLFRDIRQFGRFEFFRELPAAFSKKGPDALAVDFATFYERLKKHRGSIKSVLLNQGFISGVGNIYADEMLFAAKIHPRTPASRISRRRAQALHKYMLKVLQAAVRLGGSSISDYVDAEGNRGMFQLSHRVYGRAGEPCAKCRGRIRRIVIAQRGTHYCPRCQRV
jgi:formamidopyrimidine-DNA glycosylase